MRRAALSSVLLLLCAAAPPPDTDAIRQCDLAAASNQDPARPAGIPGTAADAIDPELALAPCEAALAANPDSPRQMFQLARVVYQAGDQARSLRLYQDAAARGHYLSANNAGVQFMRGEGTPVDLVRAEQYLRAAADKGFPTAMRNLGEILVKRQTQAADTDAAYWFRRAAEAGVVGGMVWYGYMVEKGRGVPKDDTIAAAWYRRAAAAGNADGMTGLAVLLLYGRGVPQDRAQAIVLLRRAAELGQPEARRRIAELEPQAPSRGEKR